MKVFVKTLKGTLFGIEVKPEETVSEVKKNIETVQGADVYPAAQQMLIHQGKVLKDATTLEENKVAENSFIVIMLSKSKSTFGEEFATSTAPSAKAPPTSAAPTSTPPVSVAPQTPTATLATQTPAATLAPTAPVTAPVLSPAPAPISSGTAMEGSDVYGQAASNLVAGSNLEEIIQQILDMGGGSWDRDTVVRALQAAYNNPERAVEYLYSVSQKDFEMEKKGNQQESNATAPGTVGETVVVIDGVPDIDPAFVIDEVPITDPAVVIDEVPLTDPAVVIDEVPLTGPAVVIDEVPLTDPAVVIDGVPGIIANESTIPLSNASSAKCATESNGVLDIIPSSGTISSGNASGTAEMSEPSGLGEWLVGRKIRKWFRGRYYAGKVKMFDKERGWYRVLYEDKDSEDLDWHELEEVLVPSDGKVQLKVMAKKIAKKNMRAAIKSGKKVARPIKKDSKRKVDHASI